MLSKGEGGNTNIGTSPARVRSLQNARLSGFAVEEHESIKNLSTVEIV